MCLHYEMQLRNQRRWESLLPCGDENWTCGRFRASCPAACRAAPRAVPRPYSLSLRSPPRPRSSAAPAPRSSPRAPHEGSRSGQRTVAPPRNLTDVAVGFLSDHRFLICDCHPYIYAAVPRNAASGGGDVGPLAAAEPRSQRLRGAVRPIHQRGVLGQAIRHRRAASAHGDK